MITLHRWQARLFAMVVTLMVLSVFAGTASASASMPLHCAYLLVPIGPGSEAGSISAMPVEIGCYSSASDAIYAGTGGEMVPEQLAGDNLTQGTLDAYATPLASDYLLGREFDGTNYCCIAAGQYVEYFASSGCGPTVWQVANVGAGWNDRFESGKGFSGCDHNKKFENENFGGAVLTCTPNCSTYGVLNNQVTSLRWKP
jgi:hypothetical protein